ncbi:MAG TPA: PfkB family carbohydrate kinase [Angustibacter sp.]|nr:PfkB family carbohydrate kinase [Angustibacter sp.]
MSVQLLAVGDNVVDRYPDLGVMYPGGNAVNVAVHARRCGAVAGYVGALGTDLAGRCVLDALAAEGVDTSLVRVVDGPNAYAEVRVIDGNRVFGTGNVGVSRFRLAPDDLERAASVDVVHTGECSMIEDQLGELSAAAPMLSFDFSERPWEYVEKYAGHARIAIRSLPGSALAQATDEARRLRALGPEVVAVTLGASGAVVVRGDDVVHAPAADVAVVDTLGAGDAFIARLLVGLAAAEPLAVVVPAATAYASTTCTSFGAFGYATAVTQGNAPLDPIQHGGVDRR